MPAKRSIKNRSKIKPSVAVATMAAVAAIFAIYVYFARASSVACEGATVTLGAGDECSIRNEGGSAAFSYSSEVAFSYEIALNGKVFSSGSKSSGSGCANTNTSEGILTFRLTSGTAQVIGGKVCQDTSTASATLSCRPESRHAIKWVYSWKKIPDHISLIQGGKVLAQESSASGSKSFTQKSLKPNTTYRALVMNKSGKTLDSASCKTKQ